MNRPLQHLGVVLLTLLVLVLPVRGWAKDADPGLGRIVLSDDGQRAAMFDPATDRIVLLRDGRLHAAPRIGLRRVRGLFPVKEGWIGFGTDAANATWLFHLDADLDTLLGKARATEWEAADMDLHEGRAYLLSRDGSRLVTLDSCLVLGSCQPAAYATPTADVSLYGPPMLRLAVDPVSQMALLLDVTGAVHAADLRGGKAALRELVRASPDAIAIGPVTADPGGAVVYLTLPGQSGVQIWQVDADFRELRQTGLIPLAEMAQAEAPFAVAAGPVTPVSVRGAPLAGRTAASRDRRLVLVQGAAPGVVHVLGHGDRVVSRRLDLCAKGAIVDLAVAADGSAVGLLTTQGAILLRREALLDRQGALEVRDRDDDARTESQLTAAIQRRLLAEGYLSGLVDGIMGMPTVQALDRYALRHGLPAPERRAASALPAPLLAGLFASHLRDMPNTFAQSPEGAAVTRAAFGAFWNLHLSDIRHFRPDEIFQPRQPPGCAPVNAAPAEQHWPHVIAPLRALDGLRARIAVPILIEATMQSSAYAECAGTPDAIRPAAARFAVLSFRVARPPAEVLAAFEAFQGLRLVQDGDLFHLVSDPALVLADDDAMGQLHAMIAAYATDLRGCREAVADVAEFTRLLSGGVARGLAIRVVRVPAAGVYAVAVDANSDAAQAGAVSRAIRAVAAESADGRTGADAYVQTNRDWTIDPACRSSAIIP